jgi:hypothetical protein
MKIIEKNMKNSQFFQHLEKIFHQKKPIRALLDPGISPVLPYKYDEYNGHKGNQIRGSEGTFLERKVFFIIESSIFFMNFQ